MIKHYLLIARRHLLRNKLLSFINISGLSLGVAACLMMLSYVAHEMTFDKFHAHANRIFLMCVKAKIGADTLDLPFVSYSSGPIVMKADPRVESFIRTYSPYSAVTLVDPQRPGVKFREAHVLYADSSIFRFFSFRLRSGDPNTVLDAPFTMVITRKTAHKYFGNADPIGKTLQYDKKNAFRVTGVVEDPPSNSSIQFDFLASLESLRSMPEERFITAASNIDYGEFQTWLLLRDQHDKSEVQQVIQQTFHRLKDPASPMDRYYLTGLKDYHYNNKFHDTGSSEYLVIFSLVATVVLLLALVNYMSLATADTSVRGKEIAVRKIIGANAPAIRKQFYVESALYSLIAFLLAFVILFFFGTTIFGILGLSIDFGFIFSPLMLVLFVLLFVFTTVIAGFYPSLVLSGLDPQAILGGRGFFKHNSTTIREIFTVLQFSLAVTSIIFCLTVNSQVHFFRHTSTGVTRENVVMIPVDDSVVSHLGAFRNEIAALSGVRKTAITKYSLYSGGGTDILTASANQSTKIPLRIIYVDENFIPLLGLQWKQRPVDSFFYRQRNSMILNESAVNKFGLPPDAAGQHIQIAGTNWYGISGVLSNFVFTTLKSTIEPLGIFVKHDSSYYWAAGFGKAYIFVKVNAGAHMPELLASVKTIYEKYNITTPFSFEFLDEAFDSQYKAEQRLEMVLNICTPVIIFIACLGLFGLMYFNVNRKLKEISIRKVLGAERGAIVVLMCRKFLVLIGLSVAIACPVAWFIAHAWLQNFPFHTEAGWLIFVPTVFGTLLISLVTILMQVLKAANTNPVKNLSN